jgi:hypothetical protein
VTSPHWCRTCSLPSGVRKELLSNKEFACQRRYEDHVHNPRRCGGHFIPSSVNCTPHLAEGVARGCTNIGYKLRDAIQSTLRFVNWVGPWLVGKSSQVCDFSKWKSYSETDLRVKELLKYVRWDEVKYVFWPHFVGNNVFYNEGTDISVKRGPGWFYCNAVCY